MQLYLLQITFKCYYFELANSIQGEFNNVTDYVYYVFLHYIRQNNHIEHASAKTLLLMFPVFYSYLLHLAMKLFMLYFFLNLTSHKENSVLMHYKTLM